jgi:hypothetical protein
VWPLVAACSPLSEVACSRPAPRQSRQVQQCKKGGNEWPVTKHPSLPLLCLSLAHTRQAELHSRFHRRLFVRVCVALACGAQTCLKSSVCEQVLQGCNKLSLGLAFSVCSKRGQFCQAATWTLARQLGHSSLRLDQGAWPDLLETRWQRLRRARS